ncbi:MAG TPA: ATP-binding protein, partial [Candidatus Limnocylindrales bacterium]|nr:ATP-binding protein [Candidatus Limnocylindrales bacterium]
MAGRQLVGRDVELGRVAAALDAASHGDPTFILVLGEAGIGKTAFLRAVTWLAEARGLRALTGSGIVSGASIPYLPLVAPLRAALDSSPDDAAAGTVRAALDGPTEADPEDDPVRAARLVEAVYELIAVRPTLLVVDDVHWADAATLAVLDYLSHRAEADRLAVVAAARDDEPDALARLPIADGRRYLQLPLP